MVDRVTGDRYSSIANNGIYVFLDTSNIEISFRNAVKDRMGVDRSVILEPAPFLDMEFLTQILVRDRKVNVKNAGCSHRPDRPLPVVVKQLRKLGYQVDVRERKLLLDDPVSPIKRGYRSSRGSAPNDNAHYVEDLVDETLQTRIYESVMEDFANPGTLVLATGDGKAAKFSDGFFACANRALKMGWNVEVISWQTSLSSVWTDPTWTRHWGDRFRLIRLDWFMDELYPSLEARART